MSTVSKVPGFSVGEFIRDTGDERFAAVLPRNENESAADYTQRLAAAGLVVVLEREALRTGGYPQAKAEAVVRGTPLLVPMEPGEKPMAEAFGNATEVPFDPDGKEAWFLEQKKQILEAERVRAALYSNHSF
jgi:hypothetical protein